MQSIKKSMNFLFSKRTAAAAVLATVLGYNAYKVYNAYKTKRIERQQSQVQDPPFENKYFQEYDELADDPDAPVPAPHSHVRETTPQGDVIMSYDAERSLFCYYCDKRTVQFKYLEPLARKYVIAHGCKRLYIDFRKELMKAKDKADKAVKADKAAKADKEDKAIKEDKDKSSNSVFVQFKKYGSNNNSSNSSNKTSDNAPLSLISNLLKDKGIGSIVVGGTDVGVLKEQVTRYLYCGRLDDFKSAADAESEAQHEFNIIKPIDYASYKKLNGQ
jgi:type IV secretory pathway VirB10-like protein